MTTIKEYIEEVVLISCSGHWLQKCICLFLVDSIETILTNIILHCRSNQTFAIKMDKNNNNSYTQREEATTISKQQHKIVKKNKCLECHMKFDADEVEGIYLHWKAKHNKHKEHDNPYPSPS